MVGLLLLVTSVDWSMASAETPAQRCARETAAYNSAWAQGWAQQNGRPASEAPPPPVPYVCHDPGTQTPTTTMPTVTAPTISATPTTENGVQPTVHAPTDIPTPDASAAAVPVPTRGPKTNAARPTTTREPGSEDRSREPADEGTEGAPLYSSPGDCGKVITDLFAEPSNLSTEQAKAESKRIRRDPTFGDGRAAIADEVEHGKWPGYSNDDAPMWQADHIVSVNRLVNMLGFMDLDEDARARIANMNENLRPLHQPWNGSKGAKSFSEWPTKDQTGRREAPTRAEWEELCKDEWIATIAIMAAIAQEHSEEFPLLGDFLEPEPKRGQPSQPGSSVPTLTAVPKEGTVTPSEQPTLTATDAPEGQTYDPTQPPETVYPTEIPQTTYYPTETEVPVDPPATTGFPKVEGTMSGNEGGIAPQVTGEADVSEDPSWWDRNGSTVIVGTVGVVAAGAGIACTVATVGGCGPAAVGAGAAVVGAVAAEELRQGDYGLAGGP